MCGTAVTRTMSSTPGHCTRILRPSNTPSTSELMQVIDARSRYTGHARCHSHGLTLFRRRVVEFECVWSWCRIQSVRCKSLAYCEFKRIRFTQRITSDSSAAFPIDLILSWIARSNLEKRCFRCSLMQTSCLSGWTENRPETRCPPDRALIRTNVDSVCLAGRGRSGYIGG